MKIELNEDDIKISVLNIPIESLSEEFLEFLKETPIDYKDVDEYLGEYLYTETTLHEYLYEEEEDKYSQEVKETVQNIADLMTMHDCSYFRVIKY